MIDALAGVSFRQAPPAHAALLAIVRAGGPAELHRASAD
jgi:hypothetical protein